MIAMDRGRKIHGWAFALATLGALGATAVWAQQPAGVGAAQGKKGAPAKPGSSASAPGQAPSAAFQHDTSGLKLTAIPVNPTDAIATVNGEVITRQQLADECV